MYLTPKQQELINIIAGANPDGSPTDLDEVIERASYRPSKQSIQFTIRSLVEHGLIEKVGAEKRRGRKRALIGITALGIHFAEKRTVPSFVSSVDEEELLNDIEALLN